MTPIELPPPPHSEPKKIAFCITELDPGGAEWALYQIVSRLDRTRWSPCVYCLGKAGEVADQIRSAGIPVICYGAQSPFKLGAFSWLTSNLRNDLPLIIQGFLFHGNIVSRISGYLAGVPLRVAGHRVAERQKTWHLWIDRLTKQFVHHHICVSRGVADHVQQKLHLRQEQITVIPNGVDCKQTYENQSILRRELGFSAQSEIVLAVGRLHRQKGFDLLISAFEHIAQVSPDAHLVIVGEGAERPRLEEQIQSSGLQHKVHLIGFRSDLPHLLAEADLFVLSSRWEGMPNVVLQAMAAKLPVIATNVEGISEILVNGQSGVVVNPGSINDLRQAIEDLLNHPEKASRYSRNAQAIVTKEFTWENVVQRYHSIYDSLVKTSSSPQI